MEWSVTLLPVAVRLNMLTDGWHTEEGENPGQKCLRLVPSVFSSRSQAPNEEASGACYSQSLAQVHLLILIVEVDSTSRGSQSGPVQGWIGQGREGWELPRVIDSCKTLHNFLSLLPKGNIPVIRIRPSRWSMHREQVALCARMQPDEFIASRCSVGVKPSHVTFLLFPSSSGWHQAVLAFSIVCHHTMHITPHHTTLHRTAPHRTAPHRTAPHHSLCNCSKGSGPVTGISQLSFICQPPIPVVAVAVCSQAAVPGIATTSSTFLCIGL